VKISAREADAFVRKPPKNVVAILVYGPDGGLVRERGRALVRGKLGDDDNPFCFLELDPKTLSDDPARILDESASISLTGEGRVVLAASSRRECRQSVRPGSRLGA